MKFRLMSDGYKITDMYLSAALLARYPEQIVLNGLESVDGTRQQFFVLKGDPQFIKKQIELFFSGKFSIPDCKVYAERVRDLKSLVISSGS